MTQDLDIATNLLKTQLSLITSAERALQQLYNITVGEARNSLVYPLNLALINIARLRNSFTPAAT